DLIRGVFETCKRGGVDPPTPVPIPRHVEVRVGVFCDPEATSSSLVLEVKRKRSLMVTGQDYRLDVAESLFHACLNARLTKTAMRDKPPFLSATSSSPTAGVSPISSVQLTVTTLDGGIPRAMRAVLTEVHRVKVHGFSEREVAMAKRNHLADVRGDWVSREQTQSSALCAECIDHFLLGVPTPGIEWEYGTLEGVFATVGVEDVNVMANRFSWGRDTVVFAACPAPGRLIRAKNWLKQKLSPMLVNAVGLGGATRGTMGKPAIPGSGGTGGEGGGVGGGLATEGTLTSLMERFEERGYESSDDGNADEDWGGEEGRNGLSDSMRGGFSRHVRQGSWERVREWSHDRWGEPLEVEDILPDYLLPTGIPKGGRLDRQGSVPPEEKVFSGRDGMVNVHELTFRNGLKLSYKSTDFCDDEVVFQGIAHGGRTELPRALVPSSLMSVTIAEELGIFGVKPSKAMDMLTGRRVNMGMAINAYGREVTGSCGASDLESALQLLHLLFTAELPWDEGRLDTVLSYVREHVALQGKDPTNRFSSLVTDVNTQGHPFCASPSLALLRGLDARWSASHFKNAFCHPGAFEFLFVGAMDPLSAVPLFEKYLGSMPVPKGNMPENGVGCRSSLKIPGQAGDASLAQPFIGQVVKSRTEVTPLNVEFPPQKVVRCLRVPMSDPFALSSMTFPITLGGSRHPTHKARLLDNIMIQFVCSVLERRLMEVLRFHLGRTYTVSVQESFSIAPPMVNESDPLPGMVTVSLTCNPEDVSLLHAKTLEELERLQEVGPSSEEIQGAIEADRRDRETAERTNTYWLNMVSMQYLSPRYKGDIAETYEEIQDCRVEVYALLTPESLREAFLFFFGDRERRTEVSLMPQPRWRVLGRYISYGALVAMAAAGIVVVMRSRRGGG
ncbi:unnamed protein product, partial [Discosporangium mesarthrocarpum]